MSISRRGFLAGAAAAAAGLTGCSSPLPDYDREGRVILDFYTYAGQGWLEYFTKWLVPAFEKANPHIKVRLNTNLGEANYDTKLLTLIAGGIAPDVFHVTQTNFPLYASKGVAMPLDAMIAADADVHLDEFYPRVLNGMRYRGELVGIPSDFSAIVMMYNREILQRAGVEVPPDDWTWDDYLAISRRLTRLPQQYGTSITREYNRWPAWVWMSGGDIFNADVTRCTMDTPEAIEGLKFYGDLATKHRVAAATGMDNWLTDAELFQARRVGVYAVSRYIYKQYVHSRPLKFEWDLLPMPRGPAGRFTTFIWGGNCIMKTTRKPKEAWAFLRFICSAAGSELTVASGNALPPHRPTAEAAVKTKAHPLIPDRDHLFIEAIEYGRQAPFPARYSEYNTTLVGITDALGGLMPMDEACRTFTREVNGLLDRERA